MARIVDHAVSNKARRRNGARRSRSHVVEGALDDVDGACPLHLGVRLDVRNHQLDRREVGRDHVPKAGREVGRIQTGMLGAGSVDDHVGLSEPCGQSWIQRQCDLPTCEEALPLIGVEELQGAMIALDQWLPDDEDLPNTPGAAGDNGGFAGQNVAPVVEADEIAVVTLGEVLDETSA